MKRKTGYLAGGIFIVALVCILWAVVGQDTADFPQKMHAGDYICKVRSGAGESFDIVGMLAQEETVTVLELVEGENGQTWYKIDKDSLPKDMDITVAECYIRSDLLLLN